MKPIRRKFLHLATGAAALTALSRIAWTQTFPTRPLRLIIGYPPGYIASGARRNFACALHNILTGVTPKCPPCIPSWSYEMPSEIAA